MRTRRIPLFPLNVVLFPGMLLPLHVFETRYQELVRDCLATDRTFGVCLIQSGREVGGPAVPHGIGTTCEIVSVDRLDGGRCNLMTVGRSRFRILNVIRERAYLEAEVEFLPESDPGELGPLPERVRSALHTYLAAFLTLQGQPEPTVELPDDPAILANLVGSVLQAPVEVRQRLLEIDSPAERLCEELMALEAETAKLRSLLDQGAVTAHLFRPDVGRLSAN